MSLQTESVRQFVEETVRKHQIVVFSRSKCSECRISKEMFSSPNFPGVNVQFFDLDAINPVDACRIHKEVFKMSGQRQLPLILVNHEYDESDSDNDSPKPKKRGLRDSLGRRVNKIRNSCQLSR